MKQLKGLRVLEGMDSDMLPLGARLEYPDR